MSSDAGRQDLLECLANRLGRMQRSRRNFQNFDAPVAKINTIRERAAGIEGDAHERRDCNLIRETSGER